jgi:uncharacterized Fe-S center protein
LSPEHQTNKNYVSKVYRLFQQREFKNIASYAKFIPVQIHLQANAGVVSQLQNAD